MTPLDYVHAVRLEEAKQWLDERGYDSTLAYVRAMSIRVLEETGLLPHLNPGVLSWSDLQRLRPVAPSMGMMLETTSTPVRASVAATSAAAVAPSLPDSGVDLYVGIGGSPEGVLTAAALRAAEMQCDALFKGTSVDGVYTADPKKDPSAKRYAQITFDEAMSKNLGIMDAAAFALCRDQKLPIKVFSIFKHGALKRVVLGEDEGTLVHV